MIRKISISGLGPHENTQLDIPSPMGHTWIEGGSEVGKTTLYEGVTWALFGAGPDGSGGIARGGAG